MLRKEGKKMLRWVTSHYFSTSMYVCETFFVGLRSFDKSHPPEIFRYICSLYTYIYMYRLINTHIRQQQSLRAFSIAVHFMA